MNRSLSVILPVHNAQSRLLELANEILEVVAELTDRFELVILDDGSTDATWDVARELARRYPQVLPLRDPVRRGGSLAIQPGLREARGDVVMAHNGETAVDAREIVRLWRSLEPADPGPKSMRPAAKTMRRSPFSTAATNGRGIQTAPQIAPQRSGGFRLLRPGAIGDLRRSVAVVQEVARKNARGDADGNAGPTGTETAGLNTRRPNFLSRAKSDVRDVTLGE